MSGDNHNQAGHVCEPTRWPTDTGDRWTCPECNRRHVAAYADDRILVPDSMRAHLRLDRLGWRGVAS